MNLPNKIVKPTVADGFSTWNNYLALGFAELGIKVILDRKLWDETKKHGVKGIIPLDIYWDSGEPQRVWYDISDFLQQYYEDLGGPYFKIQMHKDYLKHMGMFPIGQIAAQESFDDTAKQLRQRINSIDHQMTAMFRNTDHVGMRIKAVRLLKENGIEGPMKIANSRNRGAVPADVIMRKLPYLEHLHLQRRSRLCLALPGVGGDWTWRHTEIMGLARCLVTIKSDYVLPHTPRDCYVEVERDLSNLVEKVKYYSENIKETERIATNGLEYYESFLSPKAQAMYMLTKLKEIG